MNQTSVDLAWHATTIKQSHGKDNIYFQTGRRILQPFFILFKLSCDKVYPKEGSYKITKLKEHLQKSVLQHGQNLEGFINLTL